MKVAMKDQYAKARESAEKKKKAEGQGHLSS